jgi:hypothetical protein
MFKKSALPMLISVALLAISTGANAGKEGRDPSPLCTVGSPFYIGVDRAALECRGDGSFGGVDAGDVADGPDAPDVDVLGQRGDGTPED